MCWLFFLNILCFLTINHILRQKAFKRTRHGVCFPSLAGEAGHQLTAVINLQLSDQSIFICQCGDRRRRTPAVPACHPPPAPAAPGGVHRRRTQSPLPPAPLEQAPTVLGTVPSCSLACFAVGRLSAQRLNRVALRVPSRDPPESGHPTSCNIEEGNSIFSKQRVRPRAYSWVNPPMRFHKFQPILFLPSVALSTSCCLLPRLLGLLFSICAARSQQFMVAPTSSVYPFNIVPQRCSIKALLTALPRLLSRILVALPGIWRWSSSYAPSESRPDAP